MAGKQVSGDGVPPSLAGMSKTQLYDIMCQMKVHILFCDTMFIHTYISINCCCSAISLIICSELEIGRL